MSSKFKTSSHRQTERHLENFDRRIRNMQTDMHSRVSNLQDNLEHRIDNEVNSLRNETIAREQKIIADLKVDTQSKINALEIEQREAMLKQATHFYDIVNQQGQEFSTKLNEQSLDLQGQIRDSHEILRRGMEEHVNDLNSRINETNDFVSRVVEQVNTNFERQQTLIDAVTNKVNDIIERQQNQEQRALMHLENCQALLNIARSNLAVQKFAPEGLNELESAFQNLPTLEDGPQAISAQASNLRQQILKVQKNAQKEQLTFDIIYTATLAQAESVLEIMQRNREVTYFRSENNEIIKNESGEGIRVEVDFWTDGAYLEVEKQIRAYREVLKRDKAKSQLTQKRVETILAELRSLELKQAELITNAALKGMLSEERVIVSEQIINVLYKSGFELKRDHTDSPLHNYLGNREKGTEFDQREGVYAVLKRGEVEITVLINPNENGRENQIVFQRNDENNDNPAELRHTIRSIRKAIEEETGSKLSEESTPSTIGDQKMVELADSNALKRGMSKELKKRLSSNY